MQEYRRSNASTQIWNDTEKEKQGPSTDPRKDTLHITGNRQSKSAGLVVARITMIWNDNDNDNDNDNHNHNDNNAKVKRPNPDVYTGLSQPRSHSLGLKVPPPWARAASGIVCPGVEVINRPLNRMFSSVSKGHTGLGQWPQPLRGPTPSQPLAWA